MRKTSRDEQILRATKEIVVKFIETGRISPTGFPEAFKAIYQAVDETVKSTVDDEATEGAAGGSNETPV
jgi:predicted transcriptional regulator